MHTAPSADQLAEALPGTWFVCATNLVVWLDGQRTEPSFEYDIASTSPLVINCHVAYTTRDGQQKVVRGKSRLRREGFVWRGNGVLKARTILWSVAGIDEEATIAVLRYRKTMTAEAGLDVIARGGAETDDIRRAVALHSAEFGLTLEDFASLNWLPPRT